MGLKLETTNDWPLVELGSLWSNSWWPGSPRSKHEQLNLIRPSGGPALMGIVSRFGFFVFLVGYTTRCWFQIFFIFTPTWGRFPIWLIFFRWVETTNQTNYFNYHIWRNRISMHFCLRKEGYTYKGCSCIVESDMGVMPRHVSHVKVMFFSFAPSCSSFCICKIAMISMLRLWIEPRTSSCETLTPHKFWNSILFHSMC